jgi:hypothetical protein
MRTIGAWRRVFAATAVLASTAPLESRAQSMCKPALTLKSTSFSQPVNMVRVWRARFDVDASRCARITGLFSIEVLSTKENGVDEAFVEPFIWRHGVTEVRVDFWHDEAPHDFHIAEIAPCECRIKP